MVSFDIVYTDDNKITNILLIGILITHTILGGETMNKEGIQ